VGQDQALIPVRTPTTPSRQERPLRRSPVRIVTSAALDVEDLVSMAPRRPGRGPAGSCFASGRRPYPLSRLRPGGLPGGCTSSQCSGPWLDLLRSGSGQYCHCHAASPRRQRLRRPTVLPVSVWASLAGPPQPTRAVTLGELAGACHGAGWGRARGGVRCLAPGAVGERNVVPDRAGVRAAAEAHADLRRPGPGRRARVLGHCSDQCATRRFRTRPHKHVDVQPLLEAGDGDGPAAPADLLAVGGRRVG
jgi:hypothetical protein